MPRAVALVDDDDRAPILVESFIRGVVVDLRMGRQPIEPWQVVAEVAAKIHATPPPPSWELRTRQAHRLETIAELEALGSEAPLVDAALSWLRAHLGAPEPGVLIHGDLLGQNLRLDPIEELGVIDWLFVEVGDPAAELAIVTRGARRPFQVVVAVPQPMAHRLTVDPWQQHHLLLEQAVLL